MVSQEPAAFPAVRRVSLCTERFYEFQRPVAPGPGNQEHGGSHPLAIRSVANSSNTAWTTKNGHRVITSRQPDPWSRQVPPPHSFPPKTHAQTRANLSLPLTTLPRQARQHYCQERGPHHPLKHRPHLPHRSTEAPVRCRRATKTGRIKAESNPHAVLAASGQVQSRRPSTTKSQVWAVSCLALRLRGEGSTHARGRAPCTISAEGRGYHAAVDGSGLW